MKKEEVEEKSKESVRCRWREKVNNNVRKGKTRFVLSMKEDGGCLVSNMKLESERFSFFFFFYFIY